MGNYKRIISESLLFIEKVDLNLNNYYFFIDLIN